MGGLSLPNVQCWQNAEDVSVAEHHNISTQWFDARRCRRRTGAQAECAHVEGTHNLIAHYRAVRQRAFPMGAAIIGHEIF